MSKRSRSNLQIDGQPASRVKLGSKLASVLYSPGIAVAKGGKVSIIGNTHSPGEALRSVYNTRYGVQVSGAIKRLDKNRRRNGSK